MSAGNLNTWQIAAALSEMSYRRDPRDQALSTDDSSTGLRSIGIGENIEQELLLLTINGQAHVKPSGLTFVRTNGTNNPDGFYYDDATGFVGHVSLVNGTIYVNFRGTDLSGGMLDAGASAVSASVGWDWMAGNPTQVDNKDFQTNVSLGFGATATTQMDDALALTQLALNYANDQVPPLNVVVSGQSLGGGLAALVSGIMNVESYGIDPAPFQRQFFAYAAESKKDMFGSSIGLLDDFIKVNSPVKQIYVDWLTNRQVANAQAIVDEIMQLRDSYLANLGEKFHEAYLSGEALNGGSIGGFLVGNGAQKISHYNSLIVPDLGDGSQVTLHGPALANLVIRTMEQDESFAVLLRGDKALRYAMIDGGLEMVAPIEHDRIDPTESPSKMLSGGINPAIMYNALWKTTGDGAQGFYHQFYTRFGDWLSKGMAADDKSATSFAPAGEPSVHQGLVWLGLQVVRDGIDRTGSAVLKSDGAAIEVFGDVSKGYVSLDLTKISAFAHFQISSQAGGQAWTGTYGLDDINAYAGKALLDDAFTGTTVPGSFVTALGWNEEKMANGIYDSIRPWTNLVVQAGANGAGLTIQEADVLTGSTLVIGGDGKNTIRTGSGADIAIGGDSDDTFFGSAGDDFIIGRGGTDTVDYSQSEGGVDIDLTRYFAGSEGTIQQGGYAQGDVLTGIEKVIGAAGHSNTFKGGDGHEEFIGGTKADTFRLSGGADKFVGGTANDTADARDMLDLSSAVQDPGLPAHGFDVDLRNQASGTVYDRNGSTLLASLNSIESVTGSAHDDRFYAGSSGGVFVGGVAPQGLQDFDTLYLSGLWANYTIQANYQGYDCRITDEFGNECLVNSVESFVFGALQIGSPGERFSFSALAQKAPAEIFLGGALGGKNVAYVTYGDQAPTASMRDGKDVVSNTQSELSGSSAAIGDYAHESLTVEGGYSALRRAIGHIEVFDENKFDVISVKLAGDSSDFFELDANGILYVKAGVTLDYAAWKAATDPLIQGNLTPNAIAAGMLNSVGHLVENEIGPKYVAHLIATDLGGNQKAGSIVFNIGPDQNSAPTDIVWKAPPAGSPFDGTPGSVRENSAAGKVVGSLQAVDPDQGDAFTYYLLSESTKFEIVGDQIRVKAGANLDYETNASWDLLIKVQDSAGAEFVKTKTVSIQDQPGWDIAFPHTEGLNLPPGARAINLGFFTDITETQAGLTGLVKISSTGDSFISDFDNGYYGIGYDSITLSGSLSSIESEMDGIFAWIPEGSYDPYMLQIETNVNGEITHGSVWVHPYAWGQ